MEVVDILDGAARELSLRRYLRHLSKDLEDVRRENFNRGDHEGWP